MKTLRTIIITTMVTLVIGVGALIGFLFNEGFVTIESESVEHVKQTVLDGKVIDEETSVELKNIRFKVNESVTVIDM